MSDDPDTDACANPGDTAWMMLASVLVLGMMPGLGFFEAGLLRPKNTISVLLQVTSGLMVLSVMWVAFGFSFTFGSTLGGVIGNPGDFPLFLSLHEGMCLPQAPNIPGIVYATFQMMFAAITPLLQTGAFAERMPYKVFIIYIILWEFFIYYPLAHWIWGGGWLSPDGPVFAPEGVYDFAGGIVIHVSAGISSFISAILLGPREKFKKNNNGRFPPSNIIMAAIGCSLLWMGWFGFNGGSALYSGALSAMAVVNTQIAASICGCIWLILSWYNGHPGMVEVMNGAVAGLAGITPASGFVTPPAACLISILLGVSSFFGVYLLKDKLQVDDALDVSVVHGWTGLLGSIALGFAASTAAYPDGTDGVFYGNPRQLAFQFLGVFVALIYSGAVSTIILKILDKTLGLRVSKEVETEGLDKRQHHEIAYGYLQRRVNIHTDDESANFIDPDLHRVDGNDSN